MALGCTSTLALALALALGARAASVRVPAPSAKAPENTALPDNVYFFESSKNAGDSERPLLHLAPAARKHYIPVGRRPTPPTHLSASHPQAPRLTPARGAVRQHATRTPSRPRACPRACPRGKAERRSNRCNFSLL